MARPHPLLEELARGEKIDGRAVTAKVVDSAQEHRLTGLLLGNVDRDGLPHGLLMRLEALDMSVSAHQRRLLETADRVHRRLSEADIDHVFFKGVVEAHRTFPQANQRPFADVDICLPADASMIEVGHLLAPALEWPRRLDHVVRTGQLSALGLRLGDSWIDLHVDPLRVGRRLRRPDLWWERTTTINIPSAGAIRAFDREASLVVFLVHQARDRFRYLLGPVEFRLHLAQDIDWDTVESLARAEGIWDQVSVATEIMANLADVPCPVASSPSARVFAWRRLWGPRVRLRGPEGRLHHRRRGVWLMPLLARGRFIDSLGWIFRSLVPSDAVLRIRHPHDDGPYWWRLIAGRIRRMIQRRLRFSQDRSKAHASTEARWG